MSARRERDAEALIAGRHRGNDTRARDVDAFFMEMRINVATSPAPRAQGELAAIFDGRRTISSTRDAGTRARPAPRRDLISARVKHISATLVAGATLFTGLASANALPGPLQRTTASLTSHVGLDLPGRTTPAHRPPGSHTPRPQPVPSPTAPTPATTVASTTTVPAPARDASSPTSTTIGTHPGAAGPSSAPGPEPTTPSTSPLTVAEPVLGAPPAVTLPHLPTLPPVTLPTLPTLPHRPAHGALAH